MFWCFLNDGFLKEKLKFCGICSLSNRELLSILLASGVKAKEAFNLANEVLKLANGLKGFYDLTLQELMNIKGIGFAKATQLLAAIEFGKRILNVHNLKLKKLYIRSPKEALNVVNLDLSKNLQEQVFCLFLDSKNGLIYKEEIFKGSLNVTIAEPRDIIRIALKVNALGIIVLHNHPSGVLLPSKKDLQFTKNLKKALDFFGIKLIDHLIFYGSNYFSLKEEGFIK